MIYGNGLSSDFIGSGVGVSLLDWSFHETHTMPIIASKSGLNYPTNVENALYVSRASVYSGGKVFPQTNGYLNSDSSAFDYSARLGVSAFTGVFCGSNYNKPFQHLYRCLNWWEFATYNDANQHLSNIDSDYGGFANVAISGWKGFDNKALIANTNVTCSAISGADATTYHGYFTVNSKRGMPGYMGGAMLFYYGNGFDKTKYIGVGFKGLGRSEINSSSDIYYKLYRFTDEDGYIKYIGNNEYIFNDPHIMGVKGFAASLPSFSYDYSGPFFVKGVISAGIYTNSARTSKQTTLNITLDDYAQYTSLRSSISYLMPDTDPDMGYVKPATGQTIYFGNYSAGCRFKTWTDTTEDKVYYTLYPFAPDIPLATGTYRGYDFLLYKDVEEFHIGSCLSAFNYIGKEWNNNAYVPWNKLKKISGKFKYLNSIFDTYGLFSGTSALEILDVDWTDCSRSFSAMFKDCTSLKIIQHPWGNISGGTFEEAFKNCISLETIPSSWSGIDPVSNMAQMFMNCKSLTGIPDNWIGLGGMTYPVSAFYGCTALKKIPNSWEGGFSSCSITDSMFYDCKSITTIPQRWTGLVATDMDYMFKNCSSLSSIESWTDFPGSTIEEIFSNCTSLKKIPNSWEGFNAGNCISAFANCTSLTDIPSSWEGKITSPNYASLFEGCTSLTGIPSAQSAWTNWGGNIYRMFANCTSLTLDPKPIMDGLNRPGNGSQMFIGCVNMANTATYITQSAYSSYFV